MDKPKWWTESYEKMRSPLERFQYLVGLSELSWQDCQDAWFESVKLIPQIAKELEHCHHPGCCCVCNHTGRCPEDGPSIIDVKE